MLQTSINQKKHKRRIENKNNNQFFLPFDGFAQTFFDLPSCSLLGQRLRATLIRFNGRSGDDVLFTLLVRLTLGVVVVEDTTGLSSRKTALLYPASIFPFSDARRELFLLKNSKYKTSYRGISQSLVPIVGRHG